MTTEATSATALLDAPAADTGAGDQAAPAGQSTPAAAAPASDKPWFDGIDDPELKSWATNKNFPDVKTALESYRGLEKLMGSEKVPLPKDENDKEGYDRLYKALGRPDAPDGYKLPVPEGMDPAFAKEASAWFHETGLNPKQAEAIAGKWNAYAEAQIKAQQEAFQVQSRNDLASLATEWGSNYDRNLELSKRAARQFGFTGDTSAAVEQAMGTKAYMAMLSKLGSGLSEHTFTDGGGKTFSMTVDAARAEQTGLMADKTFAAKYLSGDTEAKAKMERLGRVIAGVGE